MFEPRRTLDYHISMVVPVLLDHGEVCLDVDEPQDYALTRKILEG